MKSNIVKINEAQLKQIVTETVKKVLKEENSNIHKIFYDRNKSYEERLHRLGLTITETERELEELKKEYQDIQEEWEKDTQNYNDKWGDYYGEN